MATSSAAARVSGQRCTCLGLIQAMGAVLDLCGSWQMPDSAGLLKTTIGTLQAGQVGIDTDMIIQE